ncbi:MAG TPA: arginine--tRNA ligase [Candidatus Acidoferrum sp.]|nr:arginine--tRNA ligase [Candidatus Acidoferrum sp.]
MYLTLINTLRDALARHIQQHYSVSLDIVLERPPKIQMGEAASPVCFELAKRLKRAPRQIAQEIASSLPKIEGTARVEVAGGGYLNAYFDRSAFWSATLKSNRMESSPSEKPQASSREVHSALTTNHFALSSGKIIVEHTSINPNKAAHIGHVRNAVLGDTMARILRHAGYPVQVQNYIDNTGVQVADVVIGFLDMEKRTPINVKMLAIEPRFDYLCWDLYAKATQFFQEDKARAAELRGRTLKAIEEDRGEEAEVAQVVADAIVSLHLKTMARLGISYDLLARESEILHLKFWDTAFEQLKKSGAVHFVDSGKMKGCWVLPWKENEVKEVDEVKEVKEKAPAVTSAAPATESSSSFTSSTSSTSLTSDSPDDENTQDKIIVRSNGTVTYVGKDIAYQLWKFGLLGKDFHYRKWPGAPEGETVWATTSSKSDSDAPHFGEPAATVYNVIDARQAYPQEVVAEGLRRLGHTEAADKSIHLSYAFVVLTPRCATELGYELSPEDAKRPFVDMSGRKGFGVKADDLIDKLEAAALAEVVQRHAEMPEAEQKKTAHAIAIGALRFFLLKFTRNAVIAFDFRDALSFEGETGPYCQYAVVRARGIWRKGAEKSPEIASEAAIKDAAEILQSQSEESGRRFLDDPADNDLWELVLSAASLDYAVDAAIAAQEPAFAAKYAFQLAQSFNNFYHKHHILTEADPQKRAFLLSLTALVESQLVQALGVLGIEAPEKM